MASVNSPDLSYQDAPHNTDLDHLPGNYGWMPYIGNTLELLEDLYGFIDHNYKTYGEVAKIKIAGLPGLLVVGAENYKTIYTDKDKNFSAQMGYSDSLKHFYDRALLLRDFDDHRFQRRMFQTAFKTEPMRGYVDVMNPLLKANLDAWEGQPNFLFFPAIKKALLDVGATVFIGVEELGPEMDKLNEAFLNISEKGLMGLFKLDLPGFKYHKGKEGERYLSDYFTKVIPQRRAGNGKDMLTHMAKEKMENGEYFPDSDLVPQASFLLFAAHDTTTSTLNHVLLYTAQHPEWQEKLRAEALALGKETLDYDDLDKMEMMELVFKEVLRMNPSVSLMNRRSIRDSELVDAKSGKVHKVPANTQIYICPVYNHFMPDFWTDPLKFDPMRFAPGREEHKNHSFCYMPFGGGAHKCIGMHFANMIVKCFMHQFLLKYDYSLPAGYSPKMEAFPLPKTADGLPVILKARK